MHSNVLGIVDCPWPTTVKAWQRVHGIVHSYRLNVPCLSHIIKLVKSLFSKKGKVAKPLELREAFNEAKAVIRGKLDLAGYDCAKPVVLTTDPSYVAWRALVAHDRQGIPLTWLSKILSPAEQKSPANESELFAVVSALRQYPKHFAGR